MRPCPMETLPQIGNTPRNCFLATLLGWTLFSVRPSKIRISDWSSIGIFVFGARSDSPVFAFTLVLLNGFAASFKHNDSASELSSFTRVVEQLHTSFKQLSIRHTYISIVTLFKNISTTTSLCIAPIYYKN